MLNRQKWDAARFHQVLASMLGAMAGNHVLDLGCGRGASFNALLDVVGDSGKVFGFDRPEHSFVETELHHADDIRSGRLTVRNGDALDLPFPDEAFEAVLCQNVVECVHDRRALVAQAMRVLKPGGTLLLGHHDFDGVMIAGGERDLTRRLVQGYADHQQKWQDASDGQMGRLLPGLVANAGFETVEVETRVFTDLDVTRGTYAHGYIGSIVALAPAMGVNQSVAEVWSQELIEAASRGHFYFALPWMAAICRKAER